MLNGKRLRTGFSAQPLFYYFKSLNFPIIGSSFALPFAALMIPITARIRNMIDKKLMMLVRKNSLQDIAKMIALRILDAIDQAIHARKRTRP